MKTLLIISTSVLLSVTLNGFLSAKHYNLYEQTYLKCREAQIALNNEESYEDFDKALDSCIKENTYLRILGTLLFADASYLDSVP